MKKFILKNLFFITMIIGLFLCLLNYKADYKVSIINRPSIDSSNILILGDSRADRQLNPNILHSYTKLNCLNLAENSLDLYSLSKRLVNLNLKDKILIISASFWQINDGSIAQGYFRYETFNDLSMVEKIRLYGFNSELIRNQSNVIFNPNELTFGFKSRHINSGYQRIPCKEFSVKEPITTKHKFYQNIHTNGIKKKLLFNALINLDKIDCKKIIIYNAPSSPKFKKKAQSNGVWLVENEYNKVMVSFIKKINHNKLYFYDLIDLEGLTDADFYDEQHLCKDGANKFSKLVVPIFDLSPASSIAHTVALGLN